MRWKEKRQREERKKARKKKPENTQKQTNQTKREEARNKQGNKPTSGAVLGPRKLEKDGGLRGSEDEKIRRVKRKGKGEDLEKGAS